MCVCVCGAAGAGGAAQLLSPARLFGTPWIATHQDTGVNCHFLLQGIFQTQGSNPQLLCLLHGEADSLPLSHLGSPVNLLLHLICQLNSITGMHVREKNTVYIGVSTIHIFGINWGSQNVYPTDKGDHCAPGC